jgi:hypothetical protein
MRAAATLHSNKARTLKEEGQTRCSFDSFVPNTKKLLFLHGIPVSGKLSYGKEGIG